MRDIFLSMLLLAVCAPAVFIQTGCSSRGAEPYAGQGPNISLAYLQQARLYRDSGRYDLARQSYAQALSTCRSDANLEVIKRELAGCELLIRTMR